MKDHHEIARQFLNSLRDGAAPWRYPHNRLPTFEPLFGKFFSGEPRNGSEADYGDVEAIIEGSGARIKHHWRCRTPRYYRHLDKIVLPLRECFLNEPHYQATRLHEVFHHTEGRLGWIGSSHQAELVAEVGTGLIESHLRLPHDTDNTNVVKHLPWWSMDITFKPECLFDAIAQAERAAKYLLGLRRGSEYSLKNAFRQKNVTGLLAIAE